jgi:PKD repeat protein
MKIHALLLISFSLLFSTCKKDKDAETPPSISFAMTSGYKTTLPVNVVFTANSPSADNITWDFGDGTTGQGMTVNHTYTSYGAYKIKATATKLGLSTTFTKDLAITFHRRAVIKKIEVLQTPTLKPGGVDWDPGNFPDLTYDIVFPGDTIFDSGTVLNNSETGTFNVIPSQGTFIFNEDIKFNIYDKDVGNVPDQELMGTVRFKFTSVLPDTTVYVDSVQVNSGALRLMLKYEFQL